MQPKGSQAMLANRILGRSGLLIFLALLAAACGKAVEEGKTQQEIKHGQEGQTDDLIELSSPGKTIKNINNFADNTKDGLKKTMQVAEDAAEMAQDASEALKRAQKAAEKHTADLKRMIEETNERLDEIEATKKKLEETRDAAEQALSNERTAIERLYQSE